jgi:hypothetical protein
MPVETAAIGMEAFAALSKRCRDPGCHQIVASAKKERPTREQVVNDTERLLKAIGMEESYVLAAHKNANNLRHERIIRERVGAEIASERGWEIVVGRHDRDIVQRIERLDEPPAEPQRRPSDGAYRRPR